MQELAVQWTRAQSTIAAFIASIVRDHHDAEDILQRTAAAVVAKYDRYEPSRPFTSWAIGVAKIEVMRFRQERGKDRIVFDDVAIQAVASAYGEMDTRLRDLREALAQCLGQLRGRMRRVIELYVREGAATDRIAAQLGMSKNAVFVMLHRGRVALRQCVERHAAGHGGRP
jgi:RNA polymerase sigma-70 factor, ECF subfamily